jgi:hypothetical protein
MTLKDKMTRTRVALLGASGLLAAGAIAGTTVLSQAATSLPTAPAQTTPAASEAPETPGTEAAPGTPEANEPALPGGGHSDAGANADHQFDGVE